MKPDVVHLHNQRDHTVDPDRDCNCNDEQDHALHRNRPIGDFGKRNRHDFGRKDEIGADSPANHFAFVIGLAHFGDFFGKCFLIAIGAVAHRLDQLLSAFKTEVSTANHQQRRDGPREECAQQKRCGQDEQQLVLERPPRDPCNDR